MTAKKRTTCCEAPAVNTVCGRPHWLYAILWWNLVVSLSHTSLVDVQWNNCMRLISTIPRPSPL